MNSLINYKLTPIILFTITVFTLLPMKNGWAADAYHYQSSDGSMQLTCLGSDMACGKVERVTVTMPSKLTGANCTATLRDIALQHSRVSVNWIKVHSVGLLNKLTGQHFPAGTYGQTHPSFSLRHGVLRGITTKHIPCKIAADKQSTVLTLR